MEEKGFLGMAVVVRLSLIMACYFFQISAAADDYPTGPVKFLLGYSPGGSMDS